MIKFKVGDQICLRKDWEKIYKRLNPAIGYYSLSYAKDIFRRPRTIYSIRENNSILAVEGSYNGWPSSIFTKARILVKLKSEDNVQLRKNWEKLVSAHDVIKISNNLSKDYLPSPQRMVVSEASETGIRIQGTLNFLPRIVFRKIITPHHKTKTEVIGDQVIETHIKPVPPQIKEEVEKRMVDSSKSLLSEETTKHKPQVGNEVRIKENAADYFLSIPGAFTVTLQPVMKKYFGKAGVVEAIHINEIDGLCCQVFGWYWPLKTLTFLKMMPIAWENLKIGTKIRFTSIRPKEWNQDGEMDKYLSTEQTIKSLYNDVDDVRSDNTFYIIQSETDRYQWTFRLSDIAEILS